MNTSVLIVGGVAGLGLLLVVAGLMPAWPTLSETLAGLHRPPASLEAPTTTRIRALSAPLRAFGLPRRRTRADLTVLERPVATHLADQPRSASTSSRSR